MDTNRNNIFSRHSIWIDSEGERGEQLVLEDIDIALLSDEQLKLLIDSVLSDCKFADISLIDKDFFHTEMYSCDFRNVTFINTLFTKSEINDTQFTSTRFTKSNFSNSELFDCDFSECVFEGSSFINAGFWNSRFHECTFTDIDFESAYFENIGLSDVRFINPINLTKVKKLIINVGTEIEPRLLSTEASINWIMEHCIS